VTDVEKYRQLAIQRISYTHDEYGAKKLARALEQTQSALGEAASRLAASSDLLEALQGMLSATDHWNDWEPGAKERAIAQAAIAKATTPADGLQGDAG
jgi:hypothetical protein